MSVRAFTNYDDARADTYDGERALFDLHGLYWSVPLDLTIHQIDEQIRAELERLDMRAFSSMYRVAP